MGRHVYTDRTGYHIEWEFPSATGAWLEPRQEGAMQGFAVVPGQLTERGRQALLEIFGLEQAADQLPLRKIELMSPEKLELFAQTAASPSG